MGAPRDRSRELTSQVVVIVGITQHRKIFGPVYASDKDGIDVTVPYPTGEFYPRGVMFFGIIFEGAR
jgi:hypothetical protein